MGICATLVLLAACAQAPDPWSRVRELLFLRTAPDGKSYGAMEVDPPLFPDSRWILEPAKQAGFIAALDALHATEPHAHTPRERLVLLRDLWAAFDWVFEHDPDGALAAKLARALNDLRGGATEEPTDSEGVAGFPAGVLDATQGFVRLADALGRSITPAHDVHFDGRSRFEVLLRMPGGRAATLAWLERLRALPDPLTGPDDERRFRADLPLLSAGTEVALVRRALSIDPSGDLVATDLVESVQLRRFTVEDPSGQSTRFSFDISKAQELAEFRLDRSGAHPLRAFGADEYDFSSLGSHGGDPFDGDPKSFGWLKPGLVRCAGCHAQPGIYSVNSFTRMSSGPGTILSIRANDRPSVLVEADTSTLVKQALAYKRGRDSWKALRRRWSETSR